MDVVLPAATVQMLWQRATGRPPTRALAATGVVPFYLPADVSRARPVGAVAIRWDDPAPEQATICRLSWDPEVGEEAVRALISRVAGWPIARPTRPRASRRAA